MELRDLIVTPLLLTIIYILAYIIRPFVADNITGRYFIPALSLKIFAAIALGFVYQFYYSIGDTFRYHTYGSRQLWNQLVDNPQEVFSLLFFGKNSDSFLKYVSDSQVLRDPSAFFTTRVSLFFDLFTFSSYSATAVLFACVSFSCLWMMFVSYYKDYPMLSGRLALSILFVPSVVFWGSGILKDTLSLAGIALATALVRNINRNKTFSFFGIAGLLLSLYFVFSIKKYILLCFVPAVILWVFVQHLSSIKSLVMRLLLVPFVINYVILLGFYSVIRLGEEDKKYSVENLAETARITAYDIRYQTGRDAGSGYEIGELDGKFTSFLRLAPAAINVSLFRPYLWEVKNPLMLLAALESIFLLLFSVYILFKSKTEIFKRLIQPDILFCLIFSFTFAFAVGASTFNFGTLVRYKIPMLPFFAIALVLIDDLSKRERAKRFRQEAHL